MTAEMFIALMNTVAFLGMKDAKTKEEVLAYDQFLGYAASVARYNRIVVEDEITERLDEEYSRVNVNKHSASRVA